MTIKYVVIGILIATLLTPTISGIASGRDLTDNERESGFYGEMGYVLQTSRPAINPDFAPDRSCLFDVYQLHCIPGSEQECPSPQFGKVR